MYHLKIMLRSIRRGGIYSAINVGGLTIGLVVCILISLWVKDELSYDRFYPHGDRIYKVLSLNKSTSDYWETSPAPMASFMQADITQIEKYCRIGGYSHQCAFLQSGNTKFSDFSISAVDTSFFNLFAVALVSGDKRNPLPDDLSIIISESKAKLFFGDENPVGKVLKTPHDFYFTITGVMKDIPENSSVRTDILVRFDVQQRTFTGNGEWKLIEEDWGTYMYSTFFQLAVGSDPETIAEKMAEKRAEPNRGYRLQPLYEIHLYSLSGQPAGMKNVYIFSVITVLIMAIACINYMNLTTARANKRSREISVRKIWGANKFNLFGQLMGETAIMLVIALIIATWVIYLLLPAYNDLAGKNLYFNLFDRSTLFIYLAIGGIVLLLAGLYPAFFLTSFRPIDAFVAGTRRKEKALFRKILVVFQFIFSGALIVGTIAITSQLHYMQNMNPGYNKENILTTTLEGSSAIRYRTIMERLSSEPAITGTSASAFYRMMSFMNRSDVYRDKNGQMPNFAYSIADPGFFSFMGIPIVEGSYFSENGKGVILNETAAKLIGEGEPVIGKILSFGGGDQVIIGIVKDFNFDLLHTEIKPLVVNCATEWAQFLYVKVAPGKTNEAIAAVEKVWKEYNHDYDFSYSFLDEDFDEMYKSDLRIGKLFNIFAIIAILISSLGLFGLVAYIAENKTKEIGIRKVLGASVRSIVEMLSREFLILVGVAMLIAFPPAYYWLDKMLQNYAYRISLSWWMFAVAACIIIVITMLTMGFRAYHAATANPVNAIKSE